MYIYSMSWGSMVSELLHWHGFHSCGSCLRRNVRTSRYFVTIISSIALLLLIRPSEGQTEGDTAYDYQEAYEAYVDLYDESALSLGPTFDVPLINVTVVLGQSALLPCSIEYLGNHKVVWLDNGKVNSFPLTYEDRRVIDDTRFTVVRPSTKEWNLQIRDVKREDEGTYRCTINTNPVRNKLINLHVNVPPYIDDANSTKGEVTVQEGDSLDLRCATSGLPTPEVTWFKSQTELLQRCLFSPNDVSDVPGVVGRGERLTLQNVSRFCDGRYECEADNGVPPTVRRQIIVTVEFPPRIQIPTRRLGQAKGRRETILNCLITAYPHASNYWEKDGRRLASTAPKYSIEAWDEGDNTLTLSLQIKDLSRADYGDYKCVAANALGRDEQVLQLFDSEREHQLESARSSQQQQHVQQIHHYQQQQHRQRPLYEASTLAPNNMDALNSPQRGRPEQHRDLHGYPDQNGIQKQHRDIAGGSSGAIKMAGKNNGCHPNPFYSIRNLLTTILAYYSHNYIFTRLL